MLLKMALFHSFYWLSNIPVCVCVCVYVCIYIYYLYFFIHLSVSRHLGYFCVFVMNSFLILCFPASLVFTS